jgi:hypothetical protein
MGMETMLFSMYDYPDLFKRLMDNLADDYIAYYRFLEKEQLLLPTTKGERVSQGTYAFTEELPDKPHPVSREIWGYMDSQETVGVSPEMYGEFVFPYYKKIAAEYGLLSYGCCEPTHPIWDKYLSTLKNLRRVSASAWCDERFMGERLRGGRVIFHRKPSPNFLGVGDAFDENGFRAHIRHTVECARGCTLEFTQRDVYTVGGNVKKVARYVEIVREESEKHIRI